MKKIKSYYWYVGIPIAAVALGTVLFFDLIVETIQGNPHPQINYLIFALIGVGCVMMWQQVARMNKDARRIEGYYQLAITKAPAEALRAQLKGKRRDTDEVFEIITDLMGKRVSPVQHAALESELERYHAVQSRYLILPQFMSGMMVGLGLLGTFVGLLGALAEISKLIGAFSVVNSGDPAESIRLLVERLTSPMQAMGVAFSASLFGVLGSLVMGVLLVGVRNCTGELNSLLDSRVTYLTDFSNSGADSGDAKALSDAVNTLAEQSPVWHALVGALDQSERRVRDLITAMVQVSSRLELNQATQGVLIDNLQGRLAREDASLLALQATQASLAQMATRWSDAAQVEKQIAAVMQEQTLQSERFMGQLEKSTDLQQGLTQRLVSALVEGQAQQATAAQHMSALNRTMTLFSDETTGKLGEVVSAQLRSADQMTDILKSGFSVIHGLQRSASGEVIEATQSGLRDLAEAQRRAVEEGHKTVTAQLGRVSEQLAAGQSEQAVLTTQITRITEVLVSLSGSHQSAIQKVVDQHQRNFEKTAREQSDAAAQMIQATQGTRSAQLAGLEGLEQTLSELSQAFRTDGEARNLQSNRLELHLMDYSARHEALTQTLVASVSTLAARTEATEALA
jgi:hypothetical protein